MRRRWSWAAAVVIGPGNGEVGPPDVLLDRPKMLLKVWVVKEPRRAWVSVGGVLSLLLDILGDCGSFDMGGCVILEGVVEWLKAMVVMRDS
jgi:hypothetical protein